MPSKPASLASWRHSRSDMRSGYGKAHRLIDFFMSNRLGEARRSSGLASAWALASGEAPAEASAAPPAAASDVRRADRREIVAGAGRAGWVGSAGGSGSGGEVG